jgi:hypothetical protein
VPSIGNTSVSLIANPEVAPSEYVGDLDNGTFVPAGDGTSYSLPSNPTSTITISNTIRGDSDTVRKTVEHETGHEHDARTHTNRFGHDSQHTKETKGKQPHDDRPEEKKANEFRDQVENERKQYKKDHKHDNH